MTWTSARMTPGCPQGCPAQNSPLGLQKLQTTKLWAYQELQKNSQKLREVTCSVHLCEADFPVSFARVGRPTFIQCRCWGELCSLYKVARPQPSAGQKSCTHGSRNSIQYWGWGLEKGSYGISRLQFCTGKFQSAIGSPFSN